ncbi:MAG: hypothetical protein OEM05_05970 [Myxococcales bacterium]|nr:hypothetical protein [Myxococcales bacterium]
MDEKPRGRVDAAAYLYIIGGIPMLVGFMAVLFFFARTCNIPA